MNPGVVSKLQTKLSRSARKQLRKEWEALFAWARTRDDYPNFRYFHFPSGSRRFEIESDSDLLFRFKRQAAKSGKLAGCPKNTDPMFFWLDDVVGAFFRDKRAIRALKHSFWIGRRGKTGMLTFPIEASIAYLCFFSTKPAQRFPKRATWLKEKLAERTWTDRRGVTRKWTAKTVEDQFDGAPDHKTVQRILNGKWVSREVLRNLIEALNMARGKELKKIRFKDIPEIEEFLVAEVGNPTLGSQGRAV